MKCIKDEDGNILVVDRDIKERWKNYFHKLFNKEVTTSINVEYLTIREEDRNFLFYRQIQEAEVKETLKKMNNGKAIGLNNILIEVWKFLGEKCIIWLTKVFNKILGYKKMSEERRRSTLIPIYNNK